MSEIPPPSKCRAILVGIEKYALGEGFDLPGAANDALRVADLLEHHFKVPPECIELLLAPIAPASFKTTRSWKPFTLGAFEQRITTGLAQEAAGGLLFVYWSGHGAIYRPDGQQYLIAPEADEFALRSLRFNDISNVLVDTRHAHFTHQVLVVDACRSPLSKWEQGAVPSVFTLVPADVDPLRIVKQCQLFACALGQAGLLRRDQGSALTNALLADLEKAAPGQWPDFEASFSAVRQQVETASKGAQTPVVAFASDWARGRMSSAPWAVAASLHDLLLDVELPPDQIRVHAIRSVRHGMPSMPDLHAMIATLSDLPSTDGVPPLGEFLARVVNVLGDAKAAAALRERMGDMFKGSERAAIQERIAQDGSAWLLQLWYHDQLGGLDAALFDPANQPRVGFGTKTRQFAAGAIGAAILAWIDEAVEAIGDQALVIELCLPAAMLETDSDTTPIAAA
ncbi:MAG: caspase family protein, partial [Betaproteobacteria bacterium]